MCVCVSIGEDPIVVIILVLSSVKQASACSINSLLSTLVSVKQTTHAGRARPIAVTVYVNLTLGLVKKPLHILIVLRAARSRFKV